MTVGLMDVLWLVLASCVSCGLMLILSAFVTGWLVFRSKRDAQETLMTPRARKSTGPVNIDEFAPPEEEESGLPESISLQNKVFGGIFGRDSLRRGD